MRRWLARVHHDLIKHALWRARDLRDMGAAPTDRDLAALRRDLLMLPGADGEPVPASALFRDLRAEIEGAAPPDVWDALDAFAAAVAAAEAAVAEARAGAVGTVLTLEGAFADLARRLDPGR